MLYIKSTVSLAIVMPPSSSPASATLFASLLYLAISTLYVTPSQYDPSILPLQRQYVLGFFLNLGHAYKDLHDRVNFINVEDDIHTPNAASLEGLRAVYFDGNNILVKSTA